MRVIDMQGQPCPIPVIESKKALAQPETDHVLVKVDNIVAVQNLEKMAGGYGYAFAYTEKTKNLFEVVIGKDGKTSPENTPQNRLESNKPESSHSDEPEPQHDRAPSGKLVVVISRDTMGEGAEELGKILIKGFIYSLTELPVPPASVIFLNAGARLTSAGANTIDDIKKLEQKGTEVLTCGTCVNYYGLQDQLAAGSITDMYGITKKMADAGKVINI